MARKWWLGTSWKMNGTLKDARAFACALRAASLPANVLPFVIPSFTAIATVREVLPKGGPVLVGAQNTHWCDSGAWTGEVSPAQLADVGCDLVEVGHSERRGAFGESDETVNLKVHAILRHGMIPLVCFGESRQVLDGGGAGSYLLEQVAAALDGVEHPEDVLLAYEPIWAIGAAGRPATTDQVRKALEPVRDEWSGRTRGLLYGGSVNRDNAADLLGVEGLDGLFVGRAAWNPSGYLELLAIAAERQAA